MIKEMTTLVSQPKFSNKFRPASVKAISYDKNNQYKLPFKIWQTEAALADPENPTPNAVIAETLDNVPIELNLFSKKQVNFNQDDIVSLYHQLGDMLKTLDLI